MVAADVRRRILARRTLPPRYLGGYVEFDDSSPVCEMNCRNSAEGNEGNKDAGAFVRAAVRCIALSCHLFASQWGGSEYLRGLQGKSPRTSNRIGRCRHRDAPKLARMPRQARRARQECRSLARPEQRWELSRAAD